MSFEETDWRRNSTNSIDMLYGKGIRTGALGGKLLGAGGGGFLVFYVKFDNKQAVMKAMKVCLSSLRKATHRLFGFVK